MLFWLILSILISKFSVQLDMDPNCTEFDSTGVRVFSRSATNCKSIYSFPVCRQLFHINYPVLPAPGVIENPTRAYGCFEAFMVTPKFRDEELKKLAIAVCPSYCGFCCMTPEFNCVNAAAPRIDCTTITDDMCNSIRWREIIAQDCPNQCGFCLLGGCIDIAPDCATQTSLCSNPTMADFAEAYCKRTCGLCDSGSSTTTATAGSDVAGSSSTSCPDATDRSNTCAVWQRNGFCSSEYYMEDQKREYCARTCQLC